MDMNYNYPTTIFRFHGASKVIVHNYLMSDYSYQIVNSKINTFEKSVNYTLNTVEISYIQNYND